MQRSMGMLASELDSRTLNSGPFPKTLSELNDPYIQELSKRVRYDPRGMFKVERNDRSIEDAMVVTDDVFEVSRNGLRAYFVITNSLAVVAIPHLPDKDDEPIKTVPERALEGYLPSPG